MFGKQLKFSYRLSYRLYIRKSKRTPLTRVISILQNVQNWKSQSMEKNLAEKLLVRCLVLWSAIKATLSKLRQ